MDTEMVTVNIKANRNIYIVEHYMASYSMTANIRVSPRSLLLIFTYVTLRPFTHDPAPVKLLAK